LLLLSVNNATISFNTRKGIVHAVQGVSLTVDESETIGIVGESGCGKSVLCSSFLRLLPMPPAVIESGSALFEGMDLYTIPLKQLQGIRGNSIGMIFQDPMTALNPYMRIGDQLVEPLMLHRKLSRNVAVEQALAVCADIGLADVKSVLRRYPHELSGGMRQRIMIAMTVLPHPRLLIADEPTTALDVTVQAQILDLLKLLKQNFSMSMIFITHDLGVVSKIATRVLVMYAGSIVESALTSEIFSSPSHPYTRALLDAIPSLHARTHKLKAIEGMPPDQKSATIGCAFAPRCTFAVADCLHGRLSLQPLSKTHSTSCIRVLNGSIGGLL
jgi:oligopeptide transport system ATP-binding protein